MRGIAGRKMARPHDAQLGLSFTSPKSSRADRSIDRRTIEIELGIVQAQTWPARYKLHKYWGRKPANVVSKYVEFFSNPNDVVLDPFMGSGVTVVESARLRRRAVGYDVNPFAVTLSAAMLDPPSPSLFAQAARDVIGVVQQTSEFLYSTPCDKCGKSATVKSYGYKADVMREVRYRCSKCGHSAARPPQDVDLALARERLPIPANAPDADILFGWEMKKLQKKGLKRWSELFSHRNFVTAANLLAAIHGVEDARCRKWLLLSFTASLAQFTRMIADFSGKAGGPSWKINCYWLPMNWQELNPLWYFENRVAKSIAAARDLIASGAPFSLGSVSTTDSRAMPLDDETVDYIFTDPPYGGESIQYGELSLLWSLWLSQSMDLSSEVIFNPHRKLTQEHYQEGLRRVFSECFRVLRPGKWMTVTFANKDPVVWDALLNSCRSAGFLLLTAAPMKRSAPSLTETTMHSAPKADLVLTFQKPLRASEENLIRKDAETYDLSIAVRQTIEALQASAQAVTPHDVFDRITVDWFSWFYENGERPSAMQPTLSNVEEEMRLLGFSVNRGRS